MTRALPALLLLTACLPEFPKRDFVADPTADNDGDGFTELTGDCDDTRSGVYPGAPELCDDQDNDCDGRSDELEDADDDNFVTDPPIWYWDGDADGYGDLSNPTAACSVPDGYAEVAGDCDDGRSTVNPGAQEYCNDGIDDDCDGAIDDGDDDMVGDATWYRDADADGYGDASDTTVTCSAPTGYVLNDDDCDDAERRTYPDAAEVCDGIDNDCDTFVDDEDPEGIVGPARWYADTDGDGFGNPTEWTEACAAPEGTSADATDCDDTRAESHPGAAEYCDGRDNNCDGRVDEDEAVDALTFYVDSDGDGHGDPDRSRLACLMPTFHSETGTDCDDGRASVNPDATEDCSTALDEDCNGTTNDADAIGCTLFFYDGDRDGYGDDDRSQCQCTTDDAVALLAGEEDPDPGYNVTIAGDCDDSTDSISPGALELCATGDDDNCNGITNDAGAVGCTFFFEDGDGDGDGVGEGLCVCEAYSPYTADNGADCNDADAAIWTGADEVCGDGIDNNCEGTVDGSEAVDAITWYRDADEDGFGTDLITLNGCTQPEGFADSTGDCDDGRSFINPGQTEDCFTAWDDDCSGTDNDPGALGCTEFYADTDTDGFGSPEDTQCTCTVDLSSDYTSLDSSDCDDTDGAVNPSQEERCDTPDVDDNCDGEAEEWDALGCELFYEDFDGDTYGTSYSACLCEPEDEYSATRVGDCDDSEASVNPDEGYCGLRGSVDVSSAIVTGVDAGVKFVRDRPVDVLGDYDGDGIIDAAWWDVQYSSDFIRQGRVNIEFGPLPAEISREDAGFQIVGSYPNRYFGDGATFMDVDCDGARELQWHKDIKEGIYTVGYEHLYLDEAAFLFGEVDDSSSFVLSTALPELSPALNFQIDDLNDDGCPEFIRQGYHAWSETYAVLYGPITEEGYISQTIEVTEKVTDAISADLNSDGLTDFIVSHSGRWDDDSYEGDVSIWAEPSSIEGPLTTDTRQAAFVYPGLADDDNAGCEAVRVAENNGDGHPDLFLMCPNGGSVFDPFTGHLIGGLGRIWIFEGSALGFEGEIDISTAEASFQGLEVGSVGEEPGYTADIDNDGHAEVMYQPRETARTNPSIFYGPFMGVKEVGLEDSEVFFEGFPDPLKYDAGEIGLSHTDFLPRPIGDINHDGYEDIHLFTYIFAGAP